MGSRSVDPRIERGWRRCHLRRRTALTFPVPPPPQKNRSAPSDSSPETFTPGGISSCSKTSPVSGSIVSQFALVAFHVPCQSSPSTHVTPVTKRLDACEESPRFRDRSDGSSGPGTAPPRRPFRPREPGVAAASGSRDRGEHAARGRIDLLDAILGDLKQVPSLEGRSGMRGDVDRAHRRTARRIDGAQFVPEGDPDVLTVVRDAMHAVGTRKGTVLTNDLRG